MGSNPVAGRIVAMVRGRTWLVLLAAAFVTALAFPRVAAGSVALVVLCGFAGVGVLHAWQSSRGQQYRAATRVSPRAAGWLAITVVTLVAIYVFAPIFAHSIVWLKGDWGPQHAVLRSVVDHLQRGELPTWNHRISTGDAPLDVYPSLTYVLAGVIAIATGLDDALPIVLLAMAVLAHTLIAIGATRLALRFLPAPVAAAIGILLLLDLGSTSSGGVTGTLQVGLLHSAVSQVFSLLAVVAIVDAIRRPRLRTTIAIWIWTALATATHPAGLLAMLVAVVALAGVAALAQDVPRRRPLFAIAHVAIGTALAAFMWLPLGERIVMYGQHFSDVLADAPHWLVDLLTNPIPVGSFAVVVYLGYAGALGGLWSRRAIPIFVAITIIVMVVATMDAAYLALDVTPSEFAARLGAKRFYGLVRPFVFVACGYAAWLGLCRVRARRVQLDRRSAVIAAFVAGVLACVGVRFAGETAYLMTAQARLNASFRARNTEGLVAWAREQMATAGPDRWGRAVFTETDAYYAHITALTGLPAFHYGPTPNVLLRQRFEDLDPETLRRFNVRWVVSDELARPLLLGDEATERVVGGFKLREITSWDGQFARVESGSGRAVVTRLDDDAVDVELRDTTEPALVVLGTGYYPRWRATDAAGHAVPVYAYPATHKGWSFVVAAWLRPGATHFTPDGPLPSDGDGRVPSVLALVLALAVVITWSRRRYRVRALRRMARLRRLRPSRHVIIAAVSLASIALVAWGVTGSLATARALTIGRGLRGTADVSIREPDGSWGACDYVRALGEYHCEDRAVVMDTTDAIVNNEQVMWPYTTPAIAIYPTRGTLVQIRIEMQRRLAGRYWAGAHDQAVDISVTGVAPVHASQPKQIVDVPEGEHTITIETPPSAMPLRLTFVREDTLEPDLMLPMAPSTPPTP